MRSICKIKKKKKALKCWVRVQIDGNTLLYLTLRSSCNSHFPSQCTIACEMGNFVQHSLSMDLPLEVSVSLNGDAGDVFADDSLFLVSSSRRSCALLVEQSFTPHS